MRFSWIFLNALAFGTARGLSLPFSLEYPFCSTTTTLTISGDYTITSTKTVTSVTVETITTTSYSPTAIACLQTGTTIKPYRSIGLVGKREPNPTAAEDPADSVCSPTVTIIIPTISSLPCTELAFESFEVIYYTNGTTQDINFESEDYPSYSTILCQLLGQVSATDCGQWTVVFQGFLHATQTGNYTLAPTLSEDNALFFWLGEKAYSSYTNDNTDGGVSYTQPTGLPHSYAASMVAGEFLPVTFIYANGYGPALNELTITSPNGTTYPDDLNFFVPPCPNSPFVP
ncbi:hypothetical protein N7488_003133 [Penicillium malachiteum]|nr:hypothetical protein N7488_003133 [Penicillium malachiteum]